MNDKNNIWWVYSTFPNEAEAFSVAQTLLEEKKVACTNMIAGVKSQYMWEGKLCCENECILLCKTQKSLVTAVIDRVKDLHSYDVPCIMALPLQAGHAPFMQWVMSETTVSD